MRDQMGPDLRETTLGQVLMRRSTRTVENSQLLSVTAERGVILQEQSGRRDSSSSDKSLYLQVKSGDIVYNTMRMWQGVSGLSSHDGIVSPAYTVCTPAPDVNPNYLSRVLKHPGMIASFYRASQGLVSDTWNLRYAELARIPVILPPIAEQRRIVEVLDGIDDQIFHERESKLKEETTRRAVITDSLADERHPRVAVRSLLLEPPRNGYSPKEVEEWTGLLALGLGCLTPSGFQARQLKCVPVEGAGNNRSLLTDGDLLVSRANTRELVGLAGVYRDIGSPCIYPDLMMRLRPRHNLHSEVLELGLRLPEIRRRIQGFSQGTSESMVKITGEMIGDLKVPVPGQEDQESLLKAMNALRVKFERHTAVLDKLQSTKRALMDDLLTCRVRVPAKSGV
ncbi:hypothetical protein [Streptomyces sp. NBC_01506]|uniref:restriction endonuclease subunit S n=1 Tax=Streptomyces sp. NBC_01506 TaxID=2903887 RepID=UPI00386BA118